MGKEFLNLPVMKNGILLLMAFILILAQSIRAQERKASPEKSEINTIDTLSNSQNTTQMISIEEFLELKDQGTVPDDIPALLQALLLDAAGDWDGAHGIAQNDSSADGSWVHAYLHRKEGDLGNASYWYRSAGRTLPKISLDEEWEYIAMALLKKS